MKVAHYPLSEDTGTTAYDYSGEEIHGSITGAGPAATGTLSGPLSQSAYDFDGVDDEVSLGGSSLFAPSSGDQSITLWAKATDTTATKGCYGYGDTNGNWVAIFVNSDGTVQTNWDDGTTLQSVTSSRTVEGAWAHISAVRTSGNKIELYIDGVSAGTTSDTGSISSGTGSFIGRYTAGGSGTSHFNGSIADVRVYDRALSPNEIQYLYEVSQRGQFRAPVKTL